MDFSFDFSSLDFSMDRPEEETDEVGEFLRSAKINKKPVMYENALKMASEIDLKQEYFCIIGGAFIYGDFIEALCDKKDLSPKRINVTTLGMGKENIDSLINCLDYLGAEQINLIVSTYWAGVERQGLMPYLIQECRGRDFNVAVCASHMKITTIDSEKGQFTMYGSANLSSSNNVEEFAFTSDPEIFAYCNKMIDEIMKKFQIIDGLHGRTIFENNKHNRAKQMTQAVKQILEE